MAAKKIRKPRSWVIRNFGCGYDFYMAQVEMNGKVMMLANIGWDLGSAEKLYVWLGKYLKWRRQQK